MRIFFAVPRSAWVDVNLRRSLERMGHGLVRFDFPGWPDDADPVWRRVGKPATNQRLLDAFRAAQRRGPLDLFFGYLYSSVVYPETIDLIRRSGVPTVNFSCNNVHQFDLVRDIAPHFEACVVPELAAHASFLAVGARPLRIQLAANPRFYRPYPEPRVYDVTFVGQRYADRADLLDLLRRHGVDARAWGAGWQPRKRLDVAHLKAGLALLEDERLDGVQRLARRWLAVQRTGQAAAASGWPVGTATRQAGGAPGPRDRGQAGPGGRAPGGEGDAAPGGTDVLGGQSSRVLGQADDAIGKGGDAIGGPGDAARDGQTVGWLGSGDDDPIGQTTRGSGPAEIDSSAWGGPRLMQRDLVRVFSQSRLSLGFATAGSSHLSEHRLTHLRLREFEAPMSGALYLTEHQAELAEYFEIGREVLTYTGPEDLLDKTRYVLRHPEAAEQIRRAGLLRARREHTWEHRFRELFDALGVRDRA